MKLIMYKVKQGKKNERRGNGISMERLLFLSFVVTFVLLVIVQAALTSPAVRETLSISDELEGVPLGVEEFLYNEGKLGLELVNEENNQELKVLVNGDEVEVFSSKYIDIAVKDGDVVEIDGSYVQGEIEVRIISKSDNISTDCIAKSVKVNSNIEKLVKVRVKE